MSIAACYFSYRKEVEKKVKLEEEMTYMVEAMREEKEVLQERMNEQKVDRTS